MTDGKTVLKNILNSRRSTRNFTNDPISLAALNELLWAAQGQTGAMDKRTAPSAFGSQPLQFRISVSRVDGLDQGFYGLNKESGELKRLHATNRLSDLRHAAVDNQPWIEEAAIVLTLVGELAKFVSAHAVSTDKAMKFILIEAGAVAQNIALMAAEQGVGAVLVAGIEQRETAQALSLTEGQIPVLHMCIGKTVG